MCFRPSDIQAANACLKCGFDNPEGVTVCEQCGAELQQLGAGYAAPGAPGAPGVPAPGVPAPGVAAPGVPAPPAK